MRISTVLLPFVASKVVERDSDGWARIKEKVDEDSFNFAILGDWVYITNKYFYKLNLIIFYNTNSGRVACSFVSKRYSAKYCSFHDENCKRNEAEIRSVIRRSFLFLRST